MASQQNDPTPKGKPKNIKWVHLLVTIEVSFLVENDPIVT
jgi:hypothetical protein